MTEQQFCSARIPNACSLFADRGADGAQGEPLCPGCHRYLHRREQPASPRPAGSRGAPAHVRKRVLARDGYHCQLRYQGCDGTASEVDHVHNVAAILRAGGTRREADNEANLHAACRTCHAIKSERERVDGLATANRQRAAARRKRLRLPVEKHPGAI